MDGNDVRMREVRCRSCLAQETSFHLVARGIGGREYLDRHRPVELYVSRQEDDTHAATPELALEEVFAGKRVLQREEFTIHGRLPSPGDRWGSIRRAQPRGFLQLAHTLVRL